MVNRIMKDVSSMIVLLAMSGTLGAQNTLKQGWEHWSKAELEQAERIAQDHIETDGGKHLLGNILQVRGAYREAVELYDQITPGYQQFDQVQVSKLSINLFHLKELEQAKALATSLEDHPVTVYAASLSQPMSVESSGSFTVPMLVNEPLNPYMPIVACRINGHERNMAFDTGGNYLILSRATARSLGIYLDTTMYFKGQQGFSTSRMWVGVADELVLGSDLVINNVPVTILEEMNTEIIIFGTNVLKEFLTTVDYPNNQFVFTTKDNTELMKAHRDQYTGNKMRFIMWGDHYMMGNGKYNGKRVNMFFDSGLVVVGEANGEVAQSWLCLSKKSMRKLGIKERRQTEALAVTATNDTLSFAGLNNENVVLSRSGIGDLSFGGIQCDLLISHGLLKNYAWTIDFDNMEYMFR